MFSKLKNILSLLILSYVISYANNIESDLKLAEQAYKQKNYNKTIEIYQNLIKNNYYSFELYYNLGNAYYKTNQLGKAILYYERAKVINPSDEDLNHNLKIAYSKTIDKIETKDNFFIEITKNNLMHKININTSAYWSILMSVLAFISFTLFLYLKTYKKALLILFGFFTISTFTVYGVSKLSEKSQKTNNFAVVTEKQIKVLSEPLSNAVSKFTLHEGTKVKILQKVDNFILIRLDNGTEGWVNEKSIEMI